MTGAMWTVLMVASLTLVLSVTTWRYVKVLDRANPISLIPKAFREAAEAKGMFDMLATTSFFAWIAFAVLFVLREAL